MNFIREYQFASAKTEKPFDGIARLNHAAIGIMTEVGEFATQIKRVAIYGKELDSVKDGARLRDHAIEELGDMAWYLSIPFNMFSEDMTLPNNGFIAAWATRHGLDAENLRTVRAEELLLVITKRMGVLAGAFVANVELGWSRDQLLGHARQLLVLIDEAAALLGTDLMRVLEQNVQKLQGGEKSRYGSAGYSDAAAEARADKDGASARVS